MYFDYNVLLSTIISTGVQYHLKLYFDKSLCVDLEGDGLPLEN